MRAVAPPPSVRCVPPPICRPGPARPSTSAAAAAPQRGPRGNTYPVPETDKERSNVDFPQEWLTPQPSRRPDTQPEFERLDPVPPPRKLPGDPELPDEDEEFEKQEKPSKPSPEEDPDAPSTEPGEEPEEEDPSQQPIPEGAA